MFLCDLAWMALLDFSMLGQACLKRLTLTVSGRRLNSLERTQSRETSAAQKWALEVEDLC